VNLVGNIRRATGTQCAAEEEIRIVHHGMRGEASIAKLCRRECVAQSTRYPGSKEYLDRQASAFRRHCVRDNQWLLKRSLIGNGERRT
jgi:transposase-like protein